MTTMQSLDQREHAGPKLKGLRVIGYARVSTATQSERGHGLGAQLDHMRSYCAANDLNLLTVTHDVVSGGSSEKMWGREAAIRAIESGLADALLVRALDRISRDQLDAAALFKRAAQRNWRLLDCERADSGDPSQRLLADIRISMAAEERRKTSERTKEGLRRARAQGKQLGRPSRIVPEIVAEIVALRTEDKVSAQRISERLDQIGVPTPGGGSKWQASTIRRLLQREGVA
ncbi:recombinase family protein [Rhodococcus sovatensis]|uniref:Recombinase family protein n=1 Tax=Rhodococcus sovatensis TaxID=1805840 RepID=A0ABZ2PMX4_9NOCA